MKSKEPEKILETDLYPPIYEYLVEQGYTVYSEVKNCDVTAVKEEELIVIEMKRSFSATLLMQATKRQRITDSVYVAIPRPKGGAFKKDWDGICHLLRRLELGLIVVSFRNGKSFVEVVFHPAPFNRTKNKKLKHSILKEIAGRYGDFNVGGSTRRKLMTAYKENSIHIACCFEKFGPLSPSQLKKLGTGPKTPSILSKNFYGWFERIERGKYYLHLDGRTGLESYSELAEHYRTEIEKNTSMGQGNG